MLANVAAKLRRLNLKSHKSFATRKAESELFLSFVDLNADLAVALSDAFNDCPSVEVIEGQLFNLECDAVVSPANSFGNMGGGIDKVIDDFYNGAAQQAIVNEISRQFMGELPVGAALVVRLESQRFPYVVCAPTMRVPGDVSKTINAYLAMRAALVAVLKHNESASNRIARLAIPGMATGVGGMGFHRAAEQMRAAYDNVIMGEWRNVVTPIMSPFALAD